MSFDEIQTIDDIYKFFIEPKKSESHFLEYKREIKNQPADLTKEVVAFANASGGMLILGIEEENNHLPKRVCYMPLKNLQHTIENHILDYIQPRFSKTSYQIKPIPNPEKESEGIFLVQVEVGDNAPYMNSEKIHYVRREKKSEKMNAQEVREAIFRKGIRDSLIAELQSNLESSKKIKKRNHALQEATRDKTEAQPHPDKPHVRAAIIPFRTEAWKAIVSSGLFSIIQEKYNILIELYNLISEFNFLAEYFKLDIRRVQTQDEDGHEHLMSKLQGLNFEIQLKLSELVKIFEKQ